MVGYEALTGRRPFPQQNLAELARAIAEQPPPPLALLRPDVDPVLAATIERAMARDPQWRFHSATAMRAALAGKLVEAPVRPPTRVLAAPLPDPTTLLVAPTVRPNRTRKLLGLAAVLAALVLAAVLLVFDSGSQPPPPQPASTSTSVPAPPPTTSVAPPTTTPPVQVDEGNPGQRKGDRGENDKKPKGDGDDD